MVIHFQFSGEDTSNYIRKGAEQLSWRNNISGINYQLHTAGSPSGWVAELVRERSWRWVSCLFVHSGPPERHDGVGLTGIVGIVTQIM